jgi:hypothetical protein
VEFLGSDPTLVQVAWPLPVGAAVTVLLLVVAGWLARPAAIAQPGSRLLLAAAWLVCVAVPLLALPRIPGATADPGHEPRLSLLMVTGWGPLAGSRGPARRQPQVLAVALAALRGPRSGGRCRQADGALGGADRVAVDDLGDRRGRAVRGGLPGWLGPSAGWSRRG